MVNLRLIVRHSSTSSVQDGAGLRGSRRYRTTGFITVILKRVSGAVNQTGCPPGEGANEHEGSRPPEHKPYPVPPRRFR